MRRLIAILFATSPFAALSDTAQDVTEARASVVAAERALEEAAKIADKEFDTWADKLPEGPRELQPDGVIGVFNFDSLSAGATPNGVAGGGQARIVGNPSGVKGRKGDALAFNGRNGVVFPELGRFVGSDAFTFSHWLELPSGIDRSVIFYRDSAARDWTSFGYAVAMDAGRIVFEIHPAWRERSIKVRTKAPVATGKWNHLAVSYDGSGRATGMNVFLNGEPALTEVIEGRLPANPDRADADSDLVLGFHPRDEGLKGGLVDELQIFARKLAPIEISALAGRDDFTEAVQSIPQLTPTQRASLLDYYIATAHYLSIEARAALKVARDAEAKRANSVSK